MAKTLLRNGRDFKWPKMLFAGNLQSRAFNGSYSRYLIKLQILRTKGCSCKKVSTIILRQKFEINISNCIFKRLIFIKVNAFLLSKSENTREKVILEYIFFILSCIAFWYLEQLELWRLIAVLSTTLAFRQRIFICLIGPTKEI